MLIHPLIAMQSPIPFFDDLTDPRIDRCKLHKLTDILFLTLCAVMSGCDTWDEIGDYGHEKHSWLKGFIELAAGIPSHDTINRLFAALDPDAFQRCFLNWVEAVSIQTGGQIIAIDGKRLCRSGLEGKKAVVHLVEAWSGANNIMLGEVRCADKSNEITAIPTLLDLLCIKGAIITIDAMGCQRDIAAAIVAKGADYVLAVKDNQHRLLENIEEAFSSGIAKAAVPFEGRNLGHGRIEYRRCRVLEADGWVEDLDGWAGLRSIAEVLSQVEDKSSGAKQEQRRYYISSLSPDATVLAGAVRAHWGIENGLHWTLDVVFREDYSTKRAGAAAQNFALLSRLTLSLLKGDKSTKGSIRRKRMKAGWSNEYLEAFLVT